MFELMNENAQEFKKQSKNQVQPSVWSVLYKLYFLQVYKLLIP